ncbi:unnamed protein product [Ceutorhynchus assimilis]|uniref:DDB1- and CUL4-associated factor 8 n=1 Tax=Ceutorhynchus assimilis TaxID=467358 RepID=A0A9N9MG69_9CUCU|nr:unnamed protein product [Ceutorhynchus assimilis]
MDENNVPEENTDENPTEHEREDRAKRIRMISNQEADSTSNGLAFAENSVPDDHSNKEDCSNSSDNSNGLVVAENFVTDSNSKNAESPTSGGTSEECSNSSPFVGGSLSISSDSGVPATYPEPNLYTGESHSSGETTNSSSPRSSYSIPESSDANDSNDSDAHSAYESMNGSGNSGWMSDVDEAVDAILKKEKPKHTFFYVPEIINRQIGYGARKAHPSLFQQRCYGSLTNVQKLELMYKLEDHEGCVNSLNFSSDGKYLASGSDDLKILLWDWKVGKSLVKINTPHRKNIFQTKFLHLNGPDIHLATCGRDGNVCYVQVANDGVREGRKLGKHGGPCHKLSVLKDQPHTILSAGEDGVVFNHDLRSNIPEKLVHVKDKVNSVSLYSIHSHPLQSHEFCVAGGDVAVRVYDQRNASKPKTAFFPYKESDARFIKGMQVTCAVYNYNGSELLTSYNDDDIFLFDTNKEPGQYMHKYTGHRNSATIKGVSFFGPKSEFIMSGSDCSHVFFWEKQTEAIVQFLLADDNGVVNCLEAHPELPFLASSGLDWDIKLWVPSCEEEPSMPDLRLTIKENKREGWGSYEARSANQVLWMLWRRLRSARVQGSPDQSFFTVDSVSASEDSSADSSESSNADDWPSGCSSS